MVISSKKVRSSDFENIEQYTKNKGFIQWVKSISKFISDDDVLLKKLQDDLLLPVTRQVESVRSELNKGRVNKYYQNQRSAVVDFLKSDVEDKEFNLIVEYLWEVSDCVLDTYNNDFHSNIYDIKQKYRGLISKKTLKQFDAIVIEVENGVALGGFNDIFNPLDYLIRGSRITSKIHPFDFYSYIIFDKNQNKFLLQHPGGTIFGQNLPSTLVLSDPIKSKYEGDSFDTVDSKEDAMLPDDDGFVTIGEKEMLGCIDKFFTNLVQNKRTFKPGQLPVVTQNNLSIWQILFNDSDYVNYRKQYFIACFNLIFEQISANEFLELLVPLVKNSVSSYSVATLGDDWKENKLIFNDLPYGMFGEESKGEHFNCQDELYCLAC
jgi:hypothetical protein